MREIEDIGEPGDHQYNDNELECPDEQHFTTNMTSTSYDKFDNNEGLSHTCYFSADFA